LTIIIDYQTSSVYYAHVKNRLRVLRAERSWSQGELADHLQVSRQTVNAIETGKYDPSLPLAFRIARLFGRSIEGVFEPAEDYAQGDGAR
jgi:putative transcriptional regulator